MAAYKDKMRLHQLYKRLKVGLVMWEDIPADDQLLLMKYYGVDRNGFW